MKDYQFYLFDADGTLFDTTEMIWRCFEHSFKHFNKPMVSQDMVYSNIGLPLRGQLEVYLGEVTDQFFEDYKKVHMGYQLSIFRDYIRLFPGVAETVQLLKLKGKKLGVVSSRLKPSLEMFLLETKILGLFDVIISPEETLKHKPNPEPALKAMEMLGCSEPSEGLFVGDASFDIECGASAGTDTAFVNWSRCDSQTFAVKPTYVITAMKELVV